MVCYLEYPDNYWPTIFHFWDGKLQKTETIHLDDFNEKLTKVKEDFKKKLTKVKEDLKKKLTATAATGLGQGGKSRRRRSHKKSTKKSKTRKNRRRL